MNHHYIIQKAIEASGAEVNGCRFGPNGKEPLYGVPIETEEGWGYEKFDPPTWLDRFAASIAADEREACAKVCEQVRSVSAVSYETGSACAAAIRARSKTCCSS